jgi:Protein of unknown function, DUF547
LRRKNGTKSGAEKYFLWPEEVIKQFLTFQRSKEMNYKHFITIIACALCMVYIWQCRTIKRSSQSRPVTHAVWDTLLHRHVGADGWVDYEGFRRDSGLLKQYLTTLSGAHPNDRYWTREEQMAYWINAYNAFTVQLVTQHYPVPSIKDIKRGVPFINTVWDIQFIKIEGYQYDLNNIEHNILRPVFKDARVHAAVNCASYSCPALRAEAYVPERLDAQLTDAMQRFVRDPLKNRIEPEKADVSSIFKWFSGDFDRDAGSVRAFINRYTPAPIAPGTDIDYIEYDWRLNDLSHRASK